MKQVKCVITDDEPTACEGLQRYVEKVDFLSLMGVCEDTMQLNTLLQTEQPDLLFLDIEMPYLSGLELLASLAHPPHVIITSAYEQYALKGYELDVTDYLLKPISFDRFLKAVNKVHGLLQQEKWPDEANNFIFVRSDRQMHKVLFKDILVVEGLENYVCIYTESSRNDHDAAAGNVCIVADIADMPGDAEQPRILFQLIHILVDRTHRFIRRHTLFPA